MSMKTMETYPALLYLNAPIGIAHGFPGACRGKLQQHVFLLGRNPIYHVTPGLCFAHPSRRDQNHMVHSEMGLSTTFTNKRGQGLGNIGDERRKLYWKLSRLMKL